MDDGMSQRAIPGAPSTDLNDRSTPELNDPQRIAFGRSFCLFARTAAKAIRRPIRF